MSAEDEGPGVAGLEEEDEPLVLGSALVTILWIVLAGLFLFGGCATPTIDEVVAGDQTLAEQVWEATWKKHNAAIGEPPPITYDEGNDPRCWDPDAFWIDDTLGCAYGAFNPNDYTIRLSRKSPAHLAQELAHAFMWQLGEPWRAYSHRHTAEYWLQACRGEFHHRRITGEDWGNEKCDGGLRQQIERSAAIGEER